MIWREGRLLARQRRANEPLPGLWEFPGGKIKDEEAPADAARRELREEMGVAAGALRLRATIDHRYPDREVRLHVFEGACDGEPFASDGAAWAWLTPEELGARPIPEANRPLIAELIDERARGR